MAKKRKRSDDPIARMAREEHEARETVRHRIKRLRGHATSDPTPRSLRAHRSADKDAVSIPEGARDE